MPNGSDVELKVVADKDGKYTFIKKHDEWRIHIYRYGEPWIVVESGANAIHALMMFIDELQHALGRR